MLNIIVLITLAVIVLVFLEKILNKLSQANTLLIKQAKDDLKNLVSENAALLKEKQALINHTEKTIALYDLTRKICKYLEEEKVFAEFKEQINKSLKFKECILLEPGSDLSLYNDSFVMPVKIKVSDKPIKYLVVCGVEKNEEEKLQILAHQFILAYKKVYLYKQVQELAITDTLTLALGRRYFLERAEEELSRSKKFKFNFSFLMIDVDNFKDYNDRFGHLVGDTILEEVASTIKENIRQIDLFGRFGGEEFCLILTETENKEGLFIADRILKAIEKKNITAYDETLNVTVSMGISSFPSTSNTIDGLIEGADSALYKAKSSGKNCIFQAG